MSAEHHSEPEADTLKTTTHDPLALGFSVVLRNICIASTGLGIYIRDYEAKPLTLSSLAYLSSGVFFAILFHKVATIEDSVDSTEADTTISANSSPEEVRPLPDTPGSRVLNHITAYQELVVAIPHPTPVEDLHLYRPHIDE